MKYKLAALPVILIAVIGMTGCSFNKDYNKAFLGDWHTMLSLDREAAASIRSYLCEAYEGENISVEEYVSGVTASATLSFYADGTFTMKVDEASLDGADDASFECLTEAFAAFINYRMSMAGLSEMTQDELSEYMADTVGMTSAEYLSEYGPMLLDHQAISDEYELSGTFTATADTITLSCDKDEMTVAYVIKDGELMFTRIISGIEYASVEVPSVYERDAVALEESPSEETGQPEDNEEDEEAGGDSEDDMEVIVIE